MKKEGLSPPQLWLCQQRATDEKGCKERELFFSLGDYCGSGSLSQNGHEGMYLYKKD